MLENGGIAIATSRRPESFADLKAKYPADRLLALRLDITKPQDIVNAFAAAKEKFGRIDVVVNNAGSGVIAEVEAAVDKDVRAMFETNFWGMANVSREAVKFFREVNPAGVGGRLLQMSGRGGLNGAAATAYYSASKFGMSGACHWMHAYPLCRKLILGCSTSIALEGFSESLADEIDPAWNIKVSIACICTLNHMR